MWFEFHLIEGTLMYLLCYGVDSFETGLMELGVSLDVTDPGLLSRKRHFQSKHSQIGRMDAVTLDRN